MKHVLAIDQGTTGSTALVVSASGEILGRGYREITQHYPQPGWVEHDPAELVLSVRDAARDAIAASGVRPDCVGITNQRETVLWASWLASRGARCARVGARRMTS